MRIPGSETRTVEDRSCDVLCACGATLTTLRPGQRAALRKPGVKMQLTCSACGKVTTVQVEAPRG